jgi:hypothetical protein
MRTQVKGSDYLDERLLERQDLPPNREAGAYKAILSLDSEHCVGG